MSEPILLVVPTVLWDGYDSVQYEYCSKVACIESDYWSAQLMFS